MRVFIGQFCLSNGEDESPKGLTLNGKQQVQSVPLLGGAVAGVYPRGNRVNTLTFAVTREHASHGAAEGFLFLHAATLPASGELTFLCEDADGGAVRYRASAAAVVSDEGSQVGVTTTHRYSLVCGVISGGELS